MVQITRNWKTEFSTDYLIVTVVENITRSVRQIIFAITVGKDWELRENCGVRAYVIPACFVYFSTHFV